MSTPAKTSNRAILAAARTILEREGAEGLTMQAVAAAVGIRTPSLYKHFADRAAVLAALRETVLAELTTQLQAVRQPGRPRKNLRAMAATYRSFAHGAPQAYLLLYSSLLPADAESPIEASAALLEDVAALTGPKQALASSRGLAAFLHGFTSLELTGAFRSGGNHERAFSQGVDQFVDGLGKR